MKSSARNRFSGTVTHVHAGPPTTYVTLDIGHGQHVTAAMTNAAATELQLQVGSSAMALIKASEVLLFTDLAGHKLSARNQLTGTVARVERGAVTTIVGLALPGDVTLTASVTNDAADELGLRSGTTATAAFKAYAVMITVKA